MNAKEREEREKLHRYSVGPFLSGSADYINQDSRSPGL